MVLDDLAARQITPSAAGRLLNTASTALSTASVERKERVSGTSFHSLLGVRLGAKVASNLAEADGVGALETIDRLLLVADRKQRAELSGSAFAREELLRQSLNDRPLCRVGVLRLVDQDMVDAAIDLEQHPGRGPGAQEQTWS